MTSISLIISIHIFILIDSQSSRRTIPPKGKSVSSDFCLIISDSVDSFAQLFSISFLIFLFQISILLAIRGMLKDMPLKPIVTYATEWQRRGQRFVVFFYFLRTVDMFDGENAYGFILPLFWICCEMNSAVNIFKTITHSCYIYTCIDWAWIKMYTDFVIFKLFLTYTIFILFDQ